MGRYVDRRAIFSAPGVADRSVGGANAARVRVREAHLDDGAWWLWLAQVPSPTPPFPVRRMFAGSSSSGLSTLGFIAAVSSAALTKTTALAHRARAYIAYHCAHTLLILLWLLHRVFIIILIDICRC